MSAPHSNPDRRDYGRSQLCRLVGLLCDEAISGEELAELESILLSDAGAREQFLEDMSVHAALEGEIAARGKVIKFVESSQHGNVRNWRHFFESEARIDVAGTPASRAYRRLVALAAMLLLAATAFIAWQSGWGFADQSGMQRHFANSDDPTGELQITELIVASVTPKSDDCHWMFEDQNIFESPNDNVRDEIRPGETLRVVGGSLDVVFKSGVAVTLTAPAIIEVISPMRSRLIRGRATVKVCPGAEGFTMNTPRTSVIDLGTVFGVEVDDFGRTDIVVFKGMVDVAYSHSFDDSANPSIGSQRLYMGEAVRVDERGTLSRIISINGNDFSVNAPATLPTTIPVISSVQDNIKRQESWKFYEIVPGGMREDAKAFVDRVHHEWNGVDSQGMPEYLVGGDYVKPFNDDKMMGDIEVLVTLERPATLYLLWCNRVPPPDWLREDFEETGGSIGVDEGRHVFKDGTVHNKDGPGIGAGVSIDSIHTVWRRVITKPGVVRLGPTGADDLDDLNMYGIVAVPLEQGPH
jgi:hypothetical protein